MDDYTTESDLAYIVMELQNELVEAYLENDNLKRLLDIKQKTIKELEKSIIDENKNNEELYTDCMSRTKKFLQRIKHFIILKFG